MPHELIVTARAKLRRTGPVVYHLKLLLSLYNGSYRLPVYPLTMYRLYVLSFLCALTFSSPTQHPLLHTADQQTLINTKPLVSSQALQDDINQDNLLKRAKHLFNLAKLADHEYNHPTRVIGSDGNRSLLTTTLQNND